MRKTNFTSHKQYLFDPLFYRNTRRLMQTKVYLNVFTLPEKKELTSLQMRQLQKKFSPVCMLSILACFLASMNVFTPCDTWKTLFFTKMFRCFKAFVTTMLLRSLT